MPPQPGSFETPALTPLAPSVEKAYYRKCIQLKRRLNEVEAANDEAKMRRLRLDRAIMKMRLERAFLLDELRKRMDHNVDGSDGSGDEGMATPPPDRPHRDKRRRQNPAPPASGAGAPPNTYPAVAYTPTAQRNASDPNAPMTSENAAWAEDGRYHYADTHAQQAQPSALPHGSPYGPPPSGLPSAPDHVNGMDVDSRSRPISREAGATGEPLAAGPSVVDQNGERRIVPPSEAHYADGQQQDSGRGAFTSVNG